MVAVILGLLLRGALRIVLSHCGHGRDRVTSVKKRISKWVTLQVALEASKCLELVELVFACVRFVGANTLELRLLSTSRPPPATAGSCCLLPLPIVSRSVRTVDVSSRFILPVLGS